MFDRGRQAFNVCKLGRRADGRAWSPRHSRNTACGRAPRLVATARGGAAAVQADMTRPPQSAVSLGFVLWRAIGDTKNVLALHCSLRPCARKVDIGLLLSLGSGLTSPTHRLLGVLPELISF
jgi:hypothetical protein